MRPMTFAEKALARAAGLSETRAGEIVEAAPDRMLSHDNTAAIARIFQNELAAEKVLEPEKLCVVLDHASPPPTADHARNHAETRAFIKAQGIEHFYEVGRGICHQVLAEAGLVLPGDLVLGADSHTTHHGWCGAFGAGIGRTELAVLWAKGRLWLRVPESIRILLHGQLPTGVTAKDICLEISRMLGADGGLYFSMEFCGSGLNSLSLESRMVIPNTMAEIGVKNAYLTPDEAVFEYLAKRTGLTLEQVRGRAVFPDEGADYAAEYDLYLDQLEPLAACPHSVDKVVPLSALSEQHIDMAFIGTCTNGRLEDLAAAAEVLHGKHIHEGVRLLVVPASNEIYLQTLQTGVLEDLIRAGAVIGVPGCGPCMGNHLGIPAKGEVVISTANRNFRGRMGEPGAEIYLASPAAVAVSALLGRIAGPASVGAYPVAPKMVMTRKQGPSITSQPSHEAPAEIGPGSKSAVVKPAAFAPAGKVWKYGENVNTDQIFPGKYTYTLRTAEEIGAHAMEDLDASFAPSVRPGDVVFGGSNFGCGSSREQAVTSLKYKGVAALVAVSFARIFYRNAINQGLPAIICPEAVAAAMAGDSVEVDLAHGVIHLPEASYHFPAFPPNVQAILEAGGLVEYVKGSASTAYLPGKKGAVA